MRCIRCGRGEQLEEHHIIAREDGGSDDPENKEWRCQPCHKYEHAKRNILKMLGREKKPSQPDRIAVLEHRLEVLEKFNTVELIKERGTYRPYWEDETTHFFPPYKKKIKREREQMAMNLVLTPKEE